MIITLLHTIITICIYALYHIQDADEASGLALLTAACRRYLHHNDDDDDNNNNDYDDDDTGSDYYDNYDFDDNYNYDGGNHTNGSLSHVSTMMMPCPK